MAETADGEEAPEGAYTPSDDELEDLVEGATADLTTGATAEDESPARTAESGTETTDDATPTEKAPAGQEGTEEPGDDADTPTDVEPATEPARAPAPNAKPFKFKASGTEHEFAGVEELTDGTLRVSKDATPQFRQVLASYVELRRTSVEERRNLQRQLVTLQRDRSDKDLEADRVTKLFKDIQAMTPEERWAWAENFTDNAKNLELEIKEERIARKERAIEAREKGPELLPEEAEEQMVSTTQREVHGTFMRLLQSPDAKIVPDEDRKALYAKWLKRAPRLAMRATEDMPEIGVKKGQLYYDDADIVDDWNERVALLRRTAKTVTAKDKNARMNADQVQRRTPPPAIRGGKTPPTTSGKKKDLRGDRKGFKKKFLAGELDAKE